MKVIFIVVLTFVLQISPLKCGLLGGLGSYPSNAQQLGLSSNKAASKSASKSKNPSPGSNLSRGLGLQSGPKRSSSKSSKKQGQSAPSLLDSSSLDAYLSPKSAKSSPRFGFLMSQPQQSPQGYKIDEGDIAILDSEFLHKTLRGIELWDKAIVYYVFHDSVNDTMRDLFNLAMKEWEDHTCIKFREKMSVDTLFYAVFRTDNDGCYSFVGRQVKDAIRGQDVNLGAGCDIMHTAVHELGHLLGLSHEQSRSDRDEYIQINFNNIEGAMHSQFQKMKTRNEDAEYDFKSVMQYPSWGFSISPFEKITMSTINPLYQYLLDEERQGLSFKDVKVVNKMYDCEMRCNNKLGLRCKNQGSLIPYKSSDKTSCVCACPPGFEGEECEYEVDPDEEKYGLEYYGGLRCGGNVTEETTISNPPRKLRVPGCSWWIQAPKNQVVQVTFNSFSFRPPESLDGILPEPKCVFEKVEVRSKNIYDPSIHCGEDLKGETITSVGSDMIIIIVGDIRGEEDLVGGGLSASIKFVDGKPMKEKKQGGLLGDLS